VPLGAPREVKRVEEVLADDLQKVEEVLEDKPLTQAELAKRAGMSQQRISRALNTLLQNRRVVRYGQGTRSSPYCYLRK